MGLYLLYESISVSNMVDLEGRVFPRIYLCAFFPTLQKEMKKINAPTKNKMNRIGTHIYNVFCLSAHSVLFQTIIGLDNLTVAFLIYPSSCPHNLLRALTSISYSGTKLSSVRGLPRFIMDG